MCMWFWFSLLIDSTNNTALIKSFNHEITVIAIFIVLSIIVKYYSMHDISDVIKVDI